MDCFLWLRRSKKVPSPYGEKFDVLVEEEKLKAAARVKAEKEKVVQTACHRLPNAADNILKADKVEFMHVPVKQAPVPAPLGIYGLDSENVAETNAANNAPYPMQELEDIPAGIRWDPWFGEEPELRIQVHIYDVSREHFIQRINKVLAYELFGLKFGGVFHAGVEVGGAEYFFGPPWCFFGIGSQTIGAGIQWGLPKLHPDYHYRQTVDMGVTPLCLEEVNDIVTEMQKDYRLDSYDLLRHNCCHFADDFTRRLQVGSIPGWVNRLAKVGVLVDRTLPLCLIRPIVRCLVGLGKLGSRTQ